MVNLGGAAFRWQGDVLDEMVASFVEKEFGVKVSHRFPGFTFEPGLFDNRRQDEQRNQIPDARWNGVLKCVQYLRVVHPSSLTAASIRFL